MTKLIPISLTTALIAGCAHSTANKSQQKIDPTIDSRIIRIIELLKETETPSVHWYIGDRVRIIKDYIRELEVAPRLWAIVKYYDVGDWKLCDEEEGKLPLRELERRGLAYKDPNSNQYLCFEDNGIETRDQLKIELEDTASCRYSQYDYGDRICSDNSPQLAEFDDTALDGKILIPKESNIRSFADGWERRDPKVYCNPLSHSCDSLNPSAELTQKTYNRLIRKVTEALERKAACFKRHNHSDRKRYMANSKDEEGQDVTVYSTEPTCIEGKLKQWNE